MTNQTKLALKLESIRKKHNLPALGAAAIVDGRIVNYSVVGIRKVDSIVRAQVNDKFHLGSISKSMTGTLLGVLVEKGLMRWNMTLSEVFPELRNSMQPEFRNVTLLMLASHRAGFRDAGKGINAMNWHAEPGTPTELRYKYLRMELTNAPAYPPGTKTHYTFGFEIAAAMCERVTHRPYEGLMKDWLFTPLGMSTAGFGPPGSKTVIDQPWQHRSHKSQRTGCRYGHRSGCYRLETVLSATKQWLNQR